MTEQPIKQVVQVILLGSEAETYLAFKRHSAKIITLMNAGVFELDSGQAEVNINNGQIQNVHIHRLTYRRENTRP